MTLLCSLPSVRACESYAVHPRSDVAEFVRSRVANVHLNMRLLARSPHASDTDPKILVGDRHDSLRDLGRGRLPASIRSDRICRRLARQDQPERLNPKQRHEPSTGHRGDLSSRSSDGQPPIPPPLTPPHRPGIYDHVATLA